MAQYILKFENGGTSTDIMEVGGKKKKKSDFLNKAMDTKNLEQFRSVVEGVVGHKLSPEEWNDALQSLRDRYNAYEKGNLILKGDNTSEDSEGKLTNRQGPNDIDAGVQTYYKMVFDKTPDFKEEDSKSKKAKFDPNSGISLLVNRRLFNGRDTFDKEFINLDKYNEETQSRGITERSKKFKSIIPLLIDSLRDTYDMDDNTYNLLVAALQALENALADDLLEEHERIALTNLGLSPDEYFFNGLVFDTPEEEEKDELTAAKEEAEKIRKQDLTKLLQLYNLYSHLEADPTLRLDSSAWIIPSRKSHKLDEKSQVLYTNWEDRNMLNFYKWLRATDIYKKDKDWWNLKNENFGLDGYMKYTSKDGEALGYEIDPNWTNGLKYSRLMEILSGWLPSHNSGPMPLTKNGSNIIYTDNGMAFIYNPITRVAETIPVKDIEGGMEALYPELYKINLALYLKEGGILKAQFGILVTPTKTYSLFEEDWERTKKEEEEKALRTEAKKQGKTVDQYKAGQRNLGDGLTGVDLARMAAIAVDLGSALASFTGVGAIAGGLGGLAGTALSLGADLNDDAIPKSEALKNAGIGLGLSLAGFIPGVGGVGKLAKVAGKVILYAPKLLSLYAAGKLALDKDVVASLKKLEGANSDMITDPIKWFKDNDVTSDDLYNIALGLGVASGFVKRGAFRAKRVIAKNAAKPTTTNKEYLVKTGLGNVAVDEKTFNSLKGANSYDDAKKIFESLKGTEGKTLRTKRRYGIVGKKDLFDKGSLKETKGVTLYVVNPEGLTTLGKWIFGEAGSKGHDLNIILNQLNNPWKIGSPNGLFFKKAAPMELAATPKATPKTTTTTKGSLSTTNSKVKPGKGPTAKSVLPWGTVDQVKNMGKPRDYAIGSYKSLADINKIKPDPSKIISVPYLDPVSGPGVIKILPDGRKIFLAYKLGGKIGFFGDGGILKGNSGLVVPDFLKDRGNSDIYSATIWDPTRKQYIKKDGKFIRQNRTNTAIDALYDNKYYRPENSLGTTEGYVPGKYESATELEGTPEFTTFNNVLKTNRDVLTMYLDDYAKYRGDGADRRIMRHRKADGSWDLDNGVIDDVLALRSDGKWGGAHDVYEGKTYYLEGDDKTFYNLTDDELKNFDVVDTNTYDDSGLIRKYMLRQKLNPTTKLLSIEEIKLRLGAIKNPSITTGGIFRDGTPEENKTTITGLEYYEPMIKGLGVGKLLGTLGTIGQNKNTLKNSIRGAYLDPLEVQSPLYGAWDILKTKINNAALAMHMAREPRTADMATNLAFLGDMNRQANAEITLGTLADDLEYKRSGEILLNNWNQGKASRVDTTNKNRDIASKVRRLHGQIDADSNLKRWNAIAGWITEQQEDMDRKQNLFRNYKLNLIASRAEQMYRDRIRDAWEEVLRAKRNLKPGENLYTSDAYRTFSEIERLAAIDRDNYTNTELASLYGWGGYNPYRSPIKIS